METWCYINILLFKIRTKCDYSLLFQIWIYVYVDHFLDKHLEPFLKAWKFDAKTYSEERKFWMFRKFRRLTELWKLPRNE